MSKLQTYRVLMRKSELHSIDLAARNEEMALLRAERLWDDGMHRRFDKVMADEPVSFEIDHPATVFRIFGCRISGYGTSRSNRERAEFIVKSD